MIWCPRDHSWGGIFLVIHTRNVPPSLPVFHCHIENGCSINLEWQRNLISFCLAPLSLPGDNHAILPNIVRHIQLKLIFKCCPNHFQEDLRNIIFHRLPLLLNNGQVKLIIVDSVAALFRVEYTPNETSKRAKALMSFGAQLHKISHHYNVAVICVNQVCEDFPYNAFQCQHSILLRARSQDSKRSIHS